MTTASCATPATIRDGSISSLSPILTPPHSSVDTNIKFQTDRSTFSFPKATSSESTGDNTRCRVKMVETRNHSNEKKEEDVANAGDKHKTEHDSPEPKRAKTGKQTTIE